LKSPFCCYALFMVTKRLPPSKTPQATPDEAQKRYAFMDAVIRQRRPEGIQLDELESALGMYMLGFHFGWKVLYLIHSKRTIRKYEGILGIKLSETFEPFGPDADRTNAFHLSQAVSNFWKAVSGDEKLPTGVDKRAMS
jgi:hypothetical protein